METFRTILKKLGCLTVGLAIMLAVISIINMLLLGMSKNLTNVVQELVGCQWTGIVNVIPQDKIPAQLRALTVKDPHLYSYFMVKYISLLGDGKTIPANGEWGLVSASEDDFSAEAFNKDTGTYVKTPGYRGTRLVSVGLWGVGWLPTEAGQIAGQKHYLNIIGITGISDKGLHTGLVEFNPDYNENFSPTVLTPDIMNNLACKFVVLNGPSKTEINCSQLGYVPNTNFESHGPSTISEAGLYLVKACSNGTWLEEIRDYSGFVQNDLPKFPVGEGIKALINEAISVLLLSQSLPVTP